MADQVFRIEALRTKVLDLLRTKSSPMKAGGIAQELGLPLWAVFTGLDSAVVGDLVVYDPLRGYSVASGVTRVCESNKALALSDSAQAATNLIA